MDDATKASYLSSWYCTDGKGGSGPATWSHVSPLAQQAFLEAVKRFSDELTEDGRKTQLVAGAASLQEVQALLAESLAKYRDSRRFPKVRKWLEKSVVRVNHFSNVINVFVQHNPEYVALAWGVMRLVLLSAQNHDNTLSLIAKAMSQIADKLSHVELATVLYPNERMRLAVGRLYADIIRFLVRAHDWCREGPIRHALHSLTRPVELRYKDLLERIDEGAREVEKLTNAGAQIQIRETNQMLIKVLAKLETVASTQALHSSALMNTNIQLSDLQFSQVMTFISKGGLGDPQKAFQFQQSLQRRYSRVSVAFEVTNRFWESPKLVEWSCAAGSGVATIRGGFNARFAMRDFSVALIRERQSKDSPILWALPGPEANGSYSLSSERQTQPPDIRNECISTVDVLKHLIMQAMRLRQSPTSEGNMSLQCARFQTATTEQEWMGLLGSSLMGANFFSQVHILVDLATLSTALQPTGDFSWQAEFERLFVEVARRAPGLQIKVLFLSYSAQRWTGLDGEFSSGAVVPVRVNQTTVRKRKFGGGGKVIGKQRRYF